MASINLELIPFAVPHMVTVKMPPGKREDGIQAAPTIALSQLSDEALTALIEEFAATVMKVAGKA